MGGDFLTLGRAELIVPLPFVEKSQQFRLTGFLDAGNVFESIDDFAAVAFGPDDRVFHQKFGYGTVTAVDQDKLTIRFDHAGEKRVMDSFVVSADQAG